MLYFKEDVCLYFFGMYYGLNCVFLFLNLYVFNEIILYYVENLWNIF